MQLEDINIGDEVICTGLLHEVHSFSSFYRSAGHIGKVSSILPTMNLVYVSHVESYADGIKEFLTPFFLDEIQPYTPPEANLKKAISKVLENKS